MRWSPLPLAPERRSGPRTPPAPSGPTRAFSLIELLVVMTIIAVVVALFLPALSGIQEQSRRTRCLSNLQQIGETLHVYANNSSDALPVMPVQAGLPALDNQWRYGGLAGLFSLRQIGDGAPGYGAASPSGLPYANGNPEPLLCTYMTAFALLRCASDREDRYYGDPYSPLGNTSLASAPVKTPQTPARAEDVVSYNLSYAYIPGVGLSRLGGGWVPIFGDETSGPDLNGHAWYGESQVPPGAATPNSTAAGAAAAGYYAPIDNHKAHGGNAVGGDGSGRWSQRWWPTGSPVID